MDLKLASFAAAVALAGNTAAADDIADMIEVPSGQPISLYEAFLEVQPDGTVWFRVRYLAPDIAREAKIVSFEEAEGDFQHLCEADALNRLDAAKAEASLIILSMMDMPIEFGVSEPRVTQLFEAFRRENATCIWEGF